MTFPGPATTDMSGGSLSEGGTPTQPSSTPAATLAAVVYRLSTGTHYPTWAALLLLGLLVPSALLVWYYTHANLKQIPKTVVGINFAAFWVCLAPFALLVLDVDAANLSVQHGQTQSVASWMKGWWMALFWGTQVLSWLVLPVGQEFCSSGGFTPKKRLYGSLKANIKMYLILGIVVGGLFAYIIVAQGLTSPTQIINLILAAANAFGLLLIILFLSYGLVELPRFLWRLADASYMLHFSYWSAPALHDAYESAKLDISDLRSSIATLETKVSEVDKPKIAKMLSKINSSPVAAGCRDGGSSAAAARRQLRELEHDIGIHDGAVVTEKELTRYHAMTIASVTYVNRYHFLWNQLVADARHYSTLSQPENRTRSRARLYGFRLVALVCGLLSLFVLWSELVLPFTSEDNKLSIVELMVVGKHQRQFGSQFIFSLSFLSYTAVASYWSVFQFNLFDVYRLVPHMSDGASLCFSATFLCRLMIPLCYNFLWCAGLTHKSTLVAYSQVFGDMDVVVFLGPWFNRYLPLLIPVMALLFVTNAFGRVAALCGMSYYTHRKHGAEEVEDTGSPTRGRSYDRVEEGRQLLSSMSPDAAVELQVVSSTPRPRHSTDGGAASGGDSGVSRPAGSRYAEWKRQQKLKQEQPE